MSNAIVAFLFMALSGFGDYLAFSYADRWVSARTLFLTEGGLGLLFFVVGGAFYLASLVFLERIIPIPVYGKILLWFAVVTVTDAIYGGVFWKMPVWMQVFAIAIALQGAAFAFLSSQYNNGG